MKIISPLSNDSHVLYRKIRNAHFAILIASVLLLILIGGAAVIFWDGIILVLLALFTGIGIFIAGLQSRMRIFGWLILIPIVVELYFGLMYGRLLFESLIFTQKSVDPFLYIFLCIALIYLLLHSYTLLLTVLTKINKKFVAAIILTIILVGVEGIVIYFSVSSMKQENKWPTVNVPECGYSFHYPPELKGEVFGGRSTAPIMDDCTHWSAGSGSFDDKIQIWGWRENSTDLISDMIRKNAREISIFFVKDVEGALSHAQEVEVGEYNALRLSSEPNKYALFIRNGNMLMGIFCPSSEIENQDWCNKVVESIKFAN